MRSEPRQLDPSANTETLLRACAAGDQGAYDYLFASIYADLRRRAGQLARAPDSTLSTTALVHETYLKLAGSNVAPVDRLHFFAIAARAMRQILLNATRDAARQKRGGDWLAITLDDALDLVTIDCSDRLAVDQALNALADANQRLATVMELHCFAGLDFAAVGELMQTSERTAKRDWRAARALMQKFLDEVEPDTHV